MDLPLDSDDVCMKCKVKPKEVDCLICSSCTSPWHIACLSNLSSNSQSENWSCPDCNIPTEFVVPVVKSVENTEDAVLLAKAREIESNAALSPKEKARLRQELFSPSSNGNTSKSNGHVGNQSKKEEHNFESPVKLSNAMQILDERMNCAFCLQMVERPVTVRLSEIFQMNRFS